jgi:hypothetical protein
MHARRRTPERALDAQAPALEGGWSQRLRDRLLDPSDTFIDSVKSSPLPLERGVVLGRA